MRTQACGTRTAELPWANADILVAKFNVATFYNSDGHEDRLVDRPFVAVPASLLQPALLWQADPGLQLRRRCLRNLPAPVKRPHQLQIAFGKSGDARQRLEPQRAAHHEQRPPLPPF